MFLNFRYHNDHCSYFLSANLESLCRSKKMLTENQSTISELFLVTITHRNKLKKYSAYQTPELSHYFISILISAGTINLYKLSKQPHSPIIYGYKNGLITSTLILSVYFV